MRSPLPDLRQVGSGMWVAMLSVTPWFWAAATHWATLRCWARAAPGDSWLSPSRGVFFLVRTTSCEEARAEMILPLAQKGESKPGDSMTGPEHRLSPPCQPRLSGLRCDMGRGGSSWSSYSLTPTHAHSSYSWATSPWPSKGRILMSLLPLVGNTVSCRL